MQHLLVTSEFMPSLGGRARRFTELARRYPEPMSVSTVADSTARHDGTEDYSIERQPFTAARAIGFANRVSWARWLVKRTRGRVAVLHSGGLDATSIPVWWAHKRERIPYVLYVSSAEIAAAAVRMASRVARRSQRLVFGDAAAIVGSSANAAVRVADIMSALGITSPPPIRAIPTGADTVRFRPSHDTSRIRTRWGIGRAPVLLTVAPLLPGRGQDIGIRAVAAIRDEFPQLRYVLVGEGSEEMRLRNLAAELHVMDRVGFAGSMRDDELPEAYATSTIYLNSAPASALSDGDGMSVLEAASTGLPVVTLDTGDEGSIIRNGVTGIHADTSDVWSVARAIIELLRDPGLRLRLGANARAVAEESRDWTRTVANTAAFVAECIGG